MPAGTGGGCSFELILALEPTRRPESEASADVAREIAPGEHLYGVNLLGDWAISREGRRRASGPMRRAGARTRPEGRR